MANKTNNRLSSYHHLVKQDFDKASLKYDDFALLQKEVADELVKIFQLQTNGRIGGNEDGLVDNLSIIDIGCGTGYMYNHIHKLITEQDKYWQIDLSPKMCFRAKENLSIITGKREAKNRFVINANMDYLPFRNNYFDYILSSFSLQWSNNLHNTLKEIMRVVKEDGKILLAIPSQNSLFELRDASKKSDINMNLHGFFSEKQIQDIFSNDVGFHNKEIVISKKTITKNYDNIFDLLKSIKNIGGRYKGDKEINNINNKKSFLELETHYNKDDNLKLPLSWEILFITIIP